MPCWCWCRPRASARCDLRPPPAWRWARWATHACPWMPRARRWPWPPATWWGPSPARPSPRRRGHPPSASAGTAGRAAGGGRPPARAGGAARPARRRRLRARRSGPGHPVRRLRRTRRRERRAVRAGGGAAGAGPHPRERTGRALAQGRVGRAGGAAPSVDLPPRRPRADAVGRQHDAERRRRGDGGGRRRDRPAGARDGPRAAAVRDRRGARAVVCTRALDAARAGLRDRAAGDRRPLRGRPPRRRHAGRGRCRRAQRRRPGLPVPDRA